MLPVVLQLPILNLKKILLIQKEMKKVKFIMILVSKGNMWTIEYIFFSIFSQSPPHIPSSLSHVFTCHV